MIRLSTASGPLPTSSSAARQFPLGKVTLSQSSATMASVKLTTFTALNEMITANSLALKNVKEQRETLKIIISCCDDRMLTEKKRQKITKNMQDRGVPVMQETVDEIVREKDVDIDKRFIEIYHNIKQMYPGMNQRRALVFMAEALIYEKIVITSSAWQEKLRDCGTNISYPTFLSTCWKIAKTDISDKMALWITGNPTMSFEGCVREQKAWLETFIAHFPGEHITWYLLMKVAYKAGLNPQADTVKEVMRGLKTKKPGIQRKQLPWMIAYLFQSLLKYPLSLPLLILYPTWAIFRLIYSPPHRKVNPPSPGGLKRGAMR